MSDHDDVEGRIVRLSIDEARSRAIAADLAETLSELSVFRIALTNPVIAKAVSQQLLALLYRGRLDPRLRELLIMRIGWSTGSEYEWTQHWRVATELGMQPDDILGVREWTTHAAYGAIERAVLAATDEVLASGIISDGTWQSLRDELDDDGVLFELVVAIGNWQLFSNLLRTLRVPLEDGVQPWPPDGRRPATFPG